MNQEEQSISFIHNTIKVQRKEDHSDNIFEWLLELNGKCKQYENEASEAKKSYIASKITKEYQDLFEQLYFNRDLSADDLTVENYHERMKAPGKANNSLVVADGKDGQMKLVMSRGGARAGAGRKKSGKEIRKVSLALDSSLWIVLETMRDSADKKKTMSDVIRESIERGLDCKCD